MTSLFVWTLGDVASLVVCIAITICYVIAKIKDAKTKE